MYKVCTLLLGLCPCLDLRLVNKPWQIAKDEKDGWRGRRCDALDRSIDDAPECSRSVTATTRPRKTTWMEAMATVTPPWRDWDRWKSHVLWNLLGQKSRFHWNHTSILLVTITKGRSHWGQGQTAKIGPKAAMLLINCFYQNHNMTIWVILHCACILSLLGAWAVDDLCRNWNKGTSATAAAPILIQIRGILKKSRISHIYPLCPPSDEAANSKTEDCT